MGSYSTSQNESLTIDLDLDFVQTGWSISGGAAIHSGCTAGIIKRKDLPTVPGKSYTVRFRITEYTSGYVSTRVGGTSGPQYTGVGSFEDTIEALNSSGIGFFSNGELAIEIDSITASGDSVISAVTLLFNDRYSQFVGYRSYDPELATKFLDDIYVFKGGSLWRQNSTDSMNTFFGEEYPSEITIVFNVNPKTIKTLSSMRLIGDSAWDVYEINIRPRGGKSEGQKSRIKKGNFKRLQGQFFADFLRDMTDPRFSSETEALFRGAELQGEVAEIKLRSTGTKQTRLLAIDILGSESQYS